MVLTRLLFSKVRPVNTLRALNHRTLVRTMSDLQAEAQAAAANAAEAPKKEKTAKEIEKEKKKAEKMAKFLAKKQKQDADAKNKKPVEAKPKKEKKVAEPVPEWIDKTKPGEKKILASLDDPAFKAYNPKNVESSWYSWWEQQKFFEPVLENGEINKKGAFTIAAPPPNVTGVLHIGHALTFAIQDSLVRYNRMKGKTTLYIPGFDHAGISTQSVVEKQIWKAEKKTRHDFGREKFLEKVWEWKEDYHGRIKSQVKRMAASFDWSKEAFTLSPELSAAVVEAFVRLHEDGTIYRASRLVNWSTKLNTAISNLEVDNKNITGRTLLSVPDYDEKIEFGLLTSYSYRVVDSDEVLTVATTRPETLFGDTGVAIHPNDERYKHLHGKFLQHPFLDRKIPIVLDAEAVDMTFGTGAVKITPAHDQNDYNTGKRHNLEFINIFTDDGLLNENCGPEWQGTKRFDARAMVIEKLKEAGLYVDQKDNEMTIPICSRSGDVIEPLLKPQWWVKQEDMAKEAIKAVKSGDITITPKTSEREYFHWMENIQDWCISRQLWWGHRCPVYFVNIEGQENDRLDNTYWVSGRSYEEALAKAEKKFPDVKFTLEQDEDVLDTWFSSGLWPISTLGWPNNTADLKNFAPLSMLETGWDILFFWVARMIMLTMKLTGKVPFKEVFCHSLVRDAQGRKMSKSLGNVVDPLDVITGISLGSLHDKLKLGNLDPKEIEKATAGQKASYPNGIPECGSDALRFALCAYTTGGRDINLDILRVEGYRKFCNKIYQATKFVLGKLGDGYEPPATSKKSGNESLVEKWILHKLTIALQAVNEHLDKREFSDATTAVYNFWYDLCDVYIENSKSLIQNGDATQSKSAQDTLYTCIDSALRMSHPFMPFLTEEMWQRLPRRAGDSDPSITVAPYPEYDAEFDDVASLEGYELVLNITKGARSLLSQYNILKNGQVYVELTDAVVRETCISQKESIISLIKGVEDIHVLENGQPVPSGCALNGISATTNVHVMVKGQIDIDAEIAKVEKKLSNLKEMQAKNADSIAKFTEKTKPEAKEAAFKRAENLSAEADGYNQTIAILEKLKL